MNDIYGIYDIILSSLDNYISGARRSGRTTLLLDTVRAGDIVIFSTSNLAKQFKIALEHRKFDVHTIRLIVCPPKHGKHLSPHCKGYTGRLLYDHKWLEEYYKCRLTSISNDLSILEANYE